jgi:ABC-type dipeptide/oligopeptide/nickel transport system ATPase component
LPDPETIGSRYPHQVSGGQLQRVMTAMAMSPRPDLIIFDEPTTALDVTTQVEVLSAMRDIVEELQHRCHLHHSRSCRGCPDGRFHQGAALW